MRRKIETKTTLYMTMNKMFSPQIHPIAVRKWLARWMFTKCSACRWKIEVKDFWGRFLRERQRPAATLSHPASAQMRRPRCKHQPRATSPLPPPAMARDYCADGFDCRVSSQEPDGYEQDCGKMGFKDEFDTDSVK